METTKDRLQQAKDALLFALHSAQHELPAKLIKELESITGKTEALQYKISKLK